MNAPLVSIVVCTYNRPEYLVDTLVSLAALNLSRLADCEIVIVDNASTDNTQIVIEEMILRMPIPARCVIETGKGVSYARNRGISESRGKWIAFIDDDEVADPDWLKQLLEMTNKMDCRCAGGAVRLRFPSSCPEDHRPGYRRILWEAGQSEQPFRFSPVKAITTGNVLFHRSIFSEIGDFDTNLKEGTEDTDLSQRMYDAGIEAWYTPTAVVEHIVPMYRLKEPYLRWRSLRNGWGLASKELRTARRSVLLLQGLARFGQMLLVNLPMHSYYKLINRNLDALYYRCRIWRAVGFLRRVMREIAPNQFSQQEFAHNLEFRGEREKFGGHK